MCSLQFQDAVAMARDQVQAYLDQVFPSALIHPKPSVRPSTAQVQGYLKAVLLKWYLTQCSGPDPLVPLFKMHVESVPKHLNAVLTLNAEDRLKGMRVKIANIDCSLICVCHSTFASVRRAAHTPTTINGNDSAVNCHR
jgi:hypothetical protein